MLGVNPGLVHEQRVVEIQKDLSMDGLTLRYAQQNAEVNGKEVELTDIEF